MSRLVRLYVCVLLGVAACTSTTNDNTGQLELSLTGAAASGTRYRLRNAVLTITGPGAPVVFQTEDDPNRTSIEQELDVAAYSLQVSAGWRLERLAGDGSATTVVATLISQNPQAFVITPGGTSSVVLQFQTAGEVVTMARGRVGITLGVTELFTVGGQVQGLVAPGLVLQNNGVDLLAINGNGPFTFSTPLPSGAVYSVTARFQPAGQLCTVSGGAGVVGVSNVTSVQVACASAPPFPVTIVNSDAAFGFLTLDNHGDLLVPRNFGPAIVRVNRLTGAQTVVTEDFGAGVFAVGAVHRAANDTIYAIVDFEVFAVAPTGTVTPFATIQRLNAIAIAPPDFGDFGGFIIGVTQTGQVLAADPETGTTTLIADTLQPCADLAFAPDGKLYISGGTTVRTVTATGAVTPFAGGFVNADGITVAPDGSRLFVADSGVNSISQLTIPGAVSTFFASAALDSGTFPSGIVAAPDNHLFVTTGPFTATIVALPF